MIDSRARVVAQTEVCRVVVKYAVAAWATNWLLFIWFVHEILFLGFEGGISFIFNILFTNVYITYKIHLYKHTTYDDCEREICFHFAYINKWSTLFLKSNRLYFFFGTCFIIVGILPVTEKLGDFFVTQKCCSVTSLTCLFRNQEKSNSFDFQKT